MAQKTARPGTNTDAAPTRAEIEAGIARVKADLVALGGMMQAYGRAQLDTLRAEAPPLDAHEALGALRRQLSALEAEMVVKVRQNPLQSLGLAALAGLIAGLILRR